MPESAGSTLNHAVDCPERHERAYEDAKLEDSLKNLAREIRSRRKSLRLTQDDLADLALCSPRFVRALEAGKATVRMDKLLAVLDVLGLELKVSTRRPQ